MSVCIPSFPGFVRSSPEDLADDMDPEKISTQESGLTTSRAIDQSPCAMLTALNDHVADYVNVRWTLVSEITTFGYVSFTSFC